jgi:hypothetical protein
MFGLGHFRKLKSKAVKKEKLFEDLGGLGEICHLDVDRAKHDDCSDLILSRYTDIYKPSEDELHSVVDDVNINLNELIALELDASDEEVKIDDNDNEVPIILKTKSVSLVI